MLSLFGSIIDGNIIVITNKNTGKIADIIVNSVEFHIKLSNISFAVFIYTIFKIYI